MALVDFIEGDVILQNTGYRLWFIYHGSYLSPVFMR